MSLFPVAPSEHVEQSALFAWARWAAGRRPELDMLLAVPNGGFRHPATAARLKAEGVKAGVPDVFLPVPCRGYHGLWLEMKRQRGGKVSPEQKEFIAKLKAHGYRVDICRGFEAAKEAIENYLS